MSVTRLKNSKTTRTSKSKSWYRLSRQGNTQLALQLNLLSPSNRFLRSQFFVLDSNLPPNQQAHKSVELVFQIRDRSSKLATFFPRESKQKLAEQKQWHVSDHPLIRPRVFCFISPYHSANIGACLLVPNSRKMSETKKALKLRKCLKPGDVSDHCLFRPWGFFPGPWLMNQHRYVLSLGAWHSHIVPNVQNGLIYVHGITLRFLS